MFSDAWERKERIRGRLQEKIQTRHPEKKPYSLFDDPGLMAQIDKIPPEMKEKYLKQGEQVYKDMDIKEKPNEMDLSFATQQAPSIKLEAPLEEEQIQEGLAYIFSALRSGIHPKDLEYNDRAFLSTYYKPEWYTEFGFTKDDLPAEAAPPESTPKE